MWSSSSPLQHICHDPNLAPGKTAALLIFQGAGAVQAWKRFFGPHAQSGLSILTENGTQQVQVVSCYTHLGCAHHHRGDMRQEARRRFTQSAFQQHRKVLYQNRKLSLHRRCELFRTLILSKYGYGCDSWTLRDRRTKHHVHTLLFTSLSTTSSWRCG